MAVYYDHLGHAEDNYTRPETPEPRDLRIGRKLALLNSRPYNYRDTDLTCRDCGAVDRTVVVVVPMVARSFERPLCGVCRTHNVQGDITKGGPFWRKD